jgi:hypothetical protein
LTFPLIGTLFGGGEGRRNIARTAAIIECIVDVLLGSAFSNLAEFECMFPHTGVVARL